MSSPEEKAHFVEYGVVALLAWAALPAGWRTGRRFVGAALFTLGAGWIDEGIQGLLPSRYYDLRDVAFNGAAGLLALGAVQLIRWARGPTGAPDGEAAPGPLSASNTFATAAFDDAPSAAPEPGSRRSPEA
ncbi:MAG: VanZ family protein [Myxococcaceae bacterium]